MAAICEKEMENEVQVKQGAKTCASGSTNGKSWAAARDGGKTKGVDGMSRQSTWPLHLEGRETRSTKSKVGHKMEEKERIKRQVAHEVDRIMEEKVHNDEKHKSHREGQKHTWSCSIVMPS